jgi:hypothetical protein
MASPGCAVCGRPVDELVDARGHAGLWFCSQSHYLDWESRRRLRRRHQLGGIVLVLALVGLALFLAYNQRGGDDTLDRYQKETPAQVRSELTACFVGHGYRVYSPSKIDPYGEHYEPDGVVFLTKVHKPSGNSISWRVYRTNIYTGKTITTIEWGTSGVSDSQLDKNPCYPS